ncbi:hypothetical protein AB3X96_34690 [Paraburkholderia sp. BR13439]|uniref:hypothetical protein n=1 Tax=Paraburkholderia sp. BR13439 TaxID=3236996 RepID=UPI0034CD77B8
MNDKAHDKTSRYLRKDVDCNTEPEQSGEGWQRTATSANRNWASGTTLVRYDWMDSRAPFALSGEGLA